MGTTTAVTGTITNDDVTPTVTLAVAPTAVSEDGNTNLVYTFTRTGSTAGELTVNYSVAGTATNGTDYTGIATSGTPKTVAFSAGSATAAVIVNPTADATVEPNETVVLKLATGTGYTVGTTTAVTGTITNDDVVGTYNAKTLIGTAINELIDGRDSQDIITGGVGPDRFAFRFGESTIAAPDWITGFEFGSDKVDLFSSSGGALASPVAFSRAADNRSATTLAGLATAVFTDANGSTTGNQALAANAAVLVTATNNNIEGTYLVINDSTASQSNTNDLLINITGFSGTLPPLGSTTPASDVFK